MARKGEDAQSHGIKEVHRDDCDGVLPNCEEMSIVWGLLGWSIDSVFALADVILSLAAVKALLMEERLLYTLFETAYLLCVGGQEMRWFYIGPE